MGVLNVAANHAQKPPAGTGLLLQALMLAMLCRTGTAQAAPSLYFGYYEDQNVTVVDAATHAVQAVIPLPGNPLGRALNPAGTRLYVSQENSENLAVIDTATNTVIATPLAGVAPDAIAFDPAGKRAYITNPLIAGLVSVLDIPRLRNNPVAAYFINRQRVSMPAYRNVLNADQLQALMHYVRWVNSGVWRTQPLNLEQ